MSSLTLCLYRLLTPQVLEFPAVNFLHLLYLYMDGTGCGSEPMQCCSQPLHPKQFQKLNSLLQQQVLLNLHLASLDLLQSFLSVQDVT